MTRRLVRALRAIANLIEAEGARRKVKEAPRTLPEAYDFITGFHYGDVRPLPIQKREEMLRLLEQLSSNPPRTVLELGSYHGGTLFFFTRVAAPDALLVTVDMPSGPFGGGYPRSWSRFFKGFARDQQTIRLVRGDTSSERTLTQVRRLVGGERAVDFLFIDADHSYNGVRSDYERYGALVRDGGIIAFHDIVPGDETFVGGVPRFWQELKSSANTHEIVESWEQGGYGIGIVRRT